MQPLEQAAHEYLSAGLSIIALTGKQPNGKFHPHGLDQPLVGVPESEEDNELIRTVFTHPTTSGLGIVITWPYIVIDIDGEDGAVEFWALTGLTELPRTPGAVTGRGAHLWFTDIAPRRSSRLGTKLDLKGPGGYVAAPPSRHPDGHTYKWGVTRLVNPESGQMNVVMELPEGIENFLTDREAIDEVPLRRYPRWTLAVRDGKFVSVPGVGNTKGLVKKMKTGEEGNRNHLLYWAACAADDDGVSLDVAMRDLSEAAEEAGLSHREAVQTIRSAYKRRKR